MPQPQKLTVLFSRHTLSLERIPFSIPVLVYPCTNAELTQIQQDRHQQMVALGTFLSPILTDYLPEIHHYLLTLPSSTSDSVPPSEDNTFELKLRQLFLDTEAPPLEFTSTTPPTDTSPSLAAPPSNPNTSQLILTYPPSTWTLSSNSPNHSHSTPVHDFITLVGLFQQLDLTLRNFLSFAYPLLRS